MEDGEAIPPRPNNYEKLEYDGLAAWLREGHRVEIEGQKPYNGYYPARIRTQLYNRGLRVKIRDHNAKIFVEMVGER